MNMQKTLKTANFCTLYLKLKLVMVYLTYKVKY